MKDISREDILKAIQIIDADPEKRKGRESSTYDLVLNNGKKYPPILVLSEANKILGGKELTIDDDFGGSAKKAFENFKKLGFNIIPKEQSFFTYLVKFIATGKSQITGKGTNLEAKSFSDELVKTYRGLVVKSSFGIGRATAIPWISFLGEGQKTSKGIYPVYLFFKEHDLLILAYGVSENNEPALKWHLKNATTISDFFFQKLIGKPKNYGNSFVFKTYNVNDQFDERKMENDLNEIIDAYALLLNNKQTESLPIVDEKGFYYEDFYEKAIQSNYIINEDLCLRYVSSLLTKPFVILTGLSGSGKTKLALVFSKWICESKEQICLVPVGADWTNRDPLLGYPSALGDKKYMLPENGALQLLIAARNNPNKPHFLILDEMNLSHVERYFADFLSAMESKEMITLHSEEEDITGVPPRISLPDNLFIIGTVNIDETTYMFSPKVLDRANVIEFRIDESEMETFFSRNVNVNIDALSKRGVNMASDFLNKATNKNLSAQADKDITTDLIEFFKELKKTGAEFGYRTAAEILRFAAVVNEIDNTWSKEQILDAAIMQKLLPKVHGSRRKLEPVLKSLAELCLHEKSLTNNVLKMNADFSFIHNQGKIKYPTSLEKIRRMYFGLINNGFTSYAEA